MSSLDLKEFEEAMVIARKHNVKLFTIREDGFCVEMNDDPIEIPASDFKPDDDTMMTEQQFNENDDYLITNPTRLG